MISIEFDGSGLGAELDALDAAIAGAVRPSAQAAADVYYREVMARVPVGESAHVMRDGRVIQPGALRAAIYQAFSPEQSTPFSKSVLGYSTALYRVSWNSRKAPHGHLVEWGHVQTRVVFRGSDGRWHTSRAKLDAPRHVAAQPFLRPAYHAAAGRAMAAAGAEFDRRVAPACTA